jgi:hypothetical protein
MVTPALAKVFAQEGIGLIAPEAGAEYLVEELRSGGREVEVVILAPGRAPEVPPGEPAPPVRPSLAPAFERTLSLADYPVLESHVLDGRPVLPTVLMLEWLAHGALHHNPGLAFHGCDGLRVLHGVFLDGPEAPAVRVVAGKAVKREGLYFVPAELRGLKPGGREMLHARAEVVLANDLPPEPAAAELPGLPPYRHSVGEAYRDLLFHGPALQGIEEVMGCGPAGIVARVRTAPGPAEWLRQPLRQRWLADPLVLDCAMQMMVLWCLQQHEAPSLPCQLGHYRQFRRSFPTGGTRVVARVGRATDLSAVADFDFLDAHGQLVARLEGYDCAMDPALRRAFRRNRLAPAACPE